MNFYNWDPLARAGLFGAIFLASLLAVLWLWYDTSDRRASGRWAWRTATSVLVALTIPALFFGAANLDSSRETLLNVLGWMCIVSGLVAGAAVVSYAAFGRAKAREFSFGSPANPGMSTLLMTNPGLEPLPTLAPTVRAPQVASSARVAAADAYFFVKAGADKGKQFPLGASTSLGRLETCTIALDDRRISGEHAQVKQSNGHFVFTDLSSTNGSFLMVGGRDEQIRVAQVLVDGDEIRVGQTVLEFVDTRNGKKR